MKKKLVLIYLVSIIIGIGVVAQADPLMERYNLGHEIMLADGTKYTIADRDSGNYGQWTDTYSPFKFSGYTALLDPPAFTGLYIGTIINDNNDNDTDLINLVNYFLKGSAYSVTSIGFSKVDNTEGTTNPDTDGSLTVTYASDDKSGTWSITSSDSTLSVDFYSVKAANEYALYFVNPALKEGTWFTNHLLTGNDNKKNGGNIPEISHLTVRLVNQTPTTDPVPEPATMILIGFGMLGIAGFQRKILKR